MSTLFGISKLAEREIFEITGGRLDSRAARAYELAQDEIAWAEYQHYCDSLESAEAEPDLPFHAFAA